MEIELKLLIPPAALEALRADPLLACVRARRKQLDNIYFDTPDRALAQARVGLRLRKDGRRWLQTVKGSGSAQAGLHQREEIEFAVAGKALQWAPLAGTPFAALLEPVWEQVVPQFRTLFSRDLRLLRGPSGAVIEVAIDQGEIIADSRREALCELELELKSGAVDDLFELALELAGRHPLMVDNRSKAERGHAMAQKLPPGAPVKAAEVWLPQGASPQTVARRAVENCLAHWQANDVGFLASSSAADGYDSEYLHQLRVAVRRLRVACDPLARLAGWQPAAMAALRGPLRSLGQQLGSARDWDVFIEETWPPLREALDDAALRMALQEAIDLQRGLAHLQAKAALRGREAQRVLLVLSRCLAQPGQAASRTGVAVDVDADALEDQLDRYDQTLWQSLPALHELKPERQHDLRIVAKKMRYLTEFSASLHAPETTEPWLKWLKKAQDGLGVRNDRATAEARFDRLAKAIEARHGKVRHTLHAALRRQELPALDLPPLPAPWWR